MSSTTNSSLHGLGALSQGQSKGQGKPELRHTDRQVPTQPPGRHHSPQGGAPGIHVSRSINYYYLNIFLILKVERNKIYNFKTIFYFSSGFNSCTYPEM